ncbi:MAG: prepilin-type N-terminal cleavage/methylation domain-containing protein [Thermodesulfobacteriota bacterium]
MTDNSKDIKQQAGFTLIELMVALTLGLFVSMIFYKTFVSFASVAGGQEQTVERNQNLRVGISHLAREVRLAGFTGSFSHLGLEAGIISAQQDSLRITRDLTGGEDDGRDNDRDGEVDEADEAVFGDGDLEDNYEDVIFMLAGPNLNGSFDLQQVDLNGASDTVIENVDGLNFVYLDEKGIPLAGPADGQNVATTPEVSRRREIRSVEITMVVRTTNEDFSYRDNRAYRNKQDSNGDGLNDLVLDAFGDKYKRRLVTATVQCRNLGL